MHDKGELEIVEDTRCVLYVPIYRIAQKVYMAFFCWRADVEYVWTLLEIFSLEIDNIYFQ